MSSRPPKAPSARSKNASSSVGVPGVQRLRERVGAVGPEGRRHVRQPLGILVAQGQADPGPPEVECAGAAQATSPADDDAHPAGQPGPLVEMAHGQAPTSMTTADPMPPPAHMEATPIPPPRRRKS